jgi:hypothetical protein
MLNHIVQSVTRFLPGNEPMRDTIEWVDSDRSWHSSSYELSHGLNVVELFEPATAFPDTLPAFHFPPATQAPAR